MVRPIKTAMQVDPLQILKRKNIDGHGINEILHREFAEVVLGFVDH